MYIYTYTEIRDGNITTQFMSTNGTSIREYYDKQVAEYKTKMKRPTETKLNLDDWCSEWDKDFSGTAREVWKGKEYKTKVVIRVMCRNFKINS
jgi:hypothetical protein